MYTHTRTLALLSGILRSYMAPENCALHPSFPNNVCKKWLRAA